MKLSKSINENENQAKDHFYLLLLTEQKFKEAYTRGGTD